MSIEMAAKLRGTANRIRQQTNATEHDVQTLHTIASEIEKLVAERDKLQAVINVASDLAGRMAGGVWGYEGNRVAEAIQEALEVKA